ncbi:MAG: Myo-inositol 2-dehydrogenase, partial [uncultured Corynebacteriales bacterium]
GATVAGGVGRPGADGPDPRGEPGLAVPVGHARRGHRRRPGGGGRGRGRAGHAGARVVRRAAVGGGRGRDRHPDRDARGPGDPGRGGRAGGVLREAGLPGPGRHRGRAGRRGRGRGAAAGRLPPPLRPGLGRGDRADPGRRAGRGLPLPHV